MTTTDSSTGRGALRRTGRTRRQLELLDRLRALFLVEGFTPFTLDDLAAQVHCSKGTLYALAPSKEQLAVAVVKHHFAVAAARVEAAIADVADVRERIGRYLAAIGEEMSAGTAAFISDVDAFAPTRDVYERNSRIASDRIRGLVAEGVDSGVFHDVHTAFVAEMVGAMIDAIQRGDVRRRTGLSDGQAFTELSALVLRALQPDVDANPHGPGHDAGAPTGATFASAKERAG